MTKNRIIGTLLMLIVIIMLTSLTIGREIVGERTPTLGSFTLIHFAGYLFFLLMPVEALVPYYLAEGHPALLLIGIAMGTALAAQTIDYAIGYAVSGDIIHNLIGDERYRKLRAAIERWGGWAIFLFNLLPLSSPNMLLVSGMVRFSARRAFLISAAGLFFKYFAIAYLFGTFTE